MHFFFLVTKIVVICYTERDHKYGILIWILEQKRYSQKNQ